MSSSAPDPSPVSRAVESTLGLFRDEGEFGRGEAEELSPRHVFSYQEDFNYLWGIGDHENQSVVEDARASEQEVTIVLVNDGVPESSEQFEGPALNVQDRITAYDWIVHFFLSVVDEDKTPNVRLFVLDVTPQETDDSFAAQRLPSLLPLMPWVRVYRLFDDLTDLQSRFGHFGVGFGQLASEVLDRDVPALASVDESTSETAEGLIREAWVNNLTRPEGRHDVSNLVAPLVLAEGLGRKEEVVESDAQRAALSRLLQTLGVLEAQEDMDEQMSSPLVCPMVADNIFGQFDHVRFLLVDDQASLGYHDVLASLLFGEEHTRQGKLESVSSEKVETGENKQCSLHSLTDPTPLVDPLFETTGLSGQGKIVDWSHPRVLDTLSASYNEEVEEAQSFDVLILDLRLFGTSGSSLGKEADFLERLIDFHDQSGAERLDDPQLERAVDAAEARVRQDSSRSQNDVSELIHLALLPLLLSYVDPSLPIVLFSSTRQQAVIDAVSHRPGIITSFQKPVVSGYAEERSPRDYVANLSEALTDALKLHEARCIWKRLVKIDWEEYPPFRATGSEKVAVTTEDSGEPDRDVTEEKKKPGNLIKKNWSVEEGELTLDVTVRVDLAENDDDESESEETDREETESERTKTWIPVRESDIDWDNGTWALDVYNYPHDDLPAFSENEHPQRSAGEMEPRLRGRSLRVRLARYYIHYLMQARYFGFTTVPYRFLEESLTPDRTLERPWISRSNFRLAEELDPRNSISSVLRQLRNRAAHGRSGPSSGSVEGHRKVSLLLTMLLLDFIEREETEYLVEDDYVDQLREALNSRYDRIEQVRGDLEPWNLVSDTGVEWLHAAVFIVWYYMEELIEGEKVLLSTETTRAVRKMGDLLIELRKGEVTACLPDRINIAARGGGLAVAREQDCITPFHDLSKGDVVRFRKESSAEEYDVAKDVWRV